MTMARWLTTRALVLVLVALSPGALTSAADAQTPTGRERVRRAIERYEAAMEATDPDARRAGLEAALAELSEAQRVEPQPLLEWNLAQIELELGEVVRALEHVERFVREVPPTHPRHPGAVALEASLARRVGAISITSTPAGARVFVGDEERGRTPITSLRVASGEVTVRVEAEGFRAETRRVRVASEGTATLTVGLERDLGAQGAVRITTALLDVQITIDGAVLGTTPLESIPLAAGVHEIVAERRGYLAVRRSVEIATGVEQVVALTLEPDPAVPNGTLSLSLPEAPARVSIDGAQSIAWSGPVPLAPGRHTIAIEVEERAPWQETIAVEEGGVHETTPELRWQDVAFTRRHDQAEAHRVGAVVTIVLGAGALLGAAGSIGWALGVAAPRLPELDARISACRLSTCSPPLGDLVQERSYYADVGPIALGVGIGLAVIGAAAVIVGSWVFGDAPSDERVRRAAHARLALGAGGLAWQLAY